MRRWNVPGASVAVVERGRPTITQAYGYRDREAGLPATPRTVYGLASITKSFTALAILRLEEEGKLSTRDPIVRHLPEFGTPDARATPRITIHHFLTHTSGLPPLPSVYYASARSLARDPSYDPRLARRVGIDTDHAPIDTYEQMMEFLRMTRYRLLGPPGRYFSYSNEAFGLLGAVIERASGRAYEGYLEEEILRPAGMRSTTFDTGVMLRYPEVTTLYSPKPTGVRHGLVPSQTWFEQSCLRACGGLRSNVEDMARYVHIFLNDGRVDGERIVTSASIRKMTTPYAELSSGLYYGYGVHVHPDFHGSPLVSHGGALPGVSSFFVIAPQRHLGGVALTNVQGVRADLPLMSEINARLGLPLMTPIEVVPPLTEPEASLREYDGWYGSGEGTWFEMRARRNALWLDFHGTEGKLRGLTLRPAGHDHFVFRFAGQDAVARFVRDARGRLWAVFLSLRLVRRRASRDFPRARKGRLVW
jgi:CubicO group peptidase (beta-lactamase class C family)